MPSAAASAHAASGTRPLDLVHLSKFTMGRRDLEAEILSLFRQQMAASMSRLAAAMDEMGEGKAWREAAHTLKGSARGVGAWELGDASERAEKLSDPAQRAGIIDELTVLVTATTGYIDELLEDWQA